MIPWKDVVKVGGGGKSIIDVHLLMEVLFKQIGKKTFYTLEVYGVLLEVLNCTVVSLQQ